MRSKLDLSAYLVIGPENTLGRPLTDIVMAALDAGFSCIQLRSKTATAKDLIKDACAISQLIADHPQGQRVSFLINDRLDVALAAREFGAKIHGIHVGQDDIPVEICRRFLGPDAVIGLSATPEEMRKALEEGIQDELDYFGLGPLHPTETKKDCGLDAEGRVQTIGFETLKELAKASPLPIVVGGGVKAADISGLSQTGVDGFFVVSAVAGADKPYDAARELVEIWQVQ